MIKLIYYIQVFIALNDNIWHTNVTTESSNHDFITIFFLVDFFFKFIVPKMST